MISSVEVLFPAVLYFCKIVCGVLGTDATHAEHIETIKARLYVGVRPDGKFVPGELGMGLVEGECMSNEPW